MPIATAPCPLPLANGREAGWVIHGVKRQGRLQDRLELLFYPLLLGIALRQIANDLIGEIGLYELDETFRPVGIVRAIFGEVRDVADIDRGIITIPESPLIDILQQRKLHLRIKIDARHPNQIIGLVEGIAITEWRLHRRRCVGLDRSHGKRPLTQLETMLDRARRCSVPPCLIEQPKTLIVAGQRNQLALFADAKRSIVEAQLIGHSLAPLQIGNKYSAGLNIKFHEIRHGYHLPHNIGLTIHFYCYPLYRLIKFGAATEVTNMDRILRKQHVELIVGLSERTLRRMEANGDFPRRFPILPDKPNGVCGWLESEVRDWLQERISSRDNHNG